MNKQTRSILSFIKKNAKPVKNEYTFRNYIHINSFFSKKEGKFIESYHLHTRIVKEHY